MTPEQLEKLPKYARDEVRYLQRQLTEAKASRDEALMATNPEESLVIINRWEDIPIGLGDATVTFKESLDAKWDLWVNVRVNRWGEIEVSCGRPISILPVAANSIKVIPEER